MLDDKQKDVFLQIRLSRELRTTFQTMCKSKAINSSELIRQFIQQWLQEQQQPIHTNNNQ